MLCTSFYCIWLHVSEIRTDSYSKIDSILHIMVPQPLIIFVLSGTPGDFFSLQDTLSFSQPTQTECRTVSLDDDLQVEPTENFYVSLTTDDNRITRSPSRATITVLNDDCE